MHISAISSVIINIAVHDSGPIYYETALRNGMIEPWNALSSLVYLIPVLFFLFRLYPNYSSHKFLIYFAVPLLLLGGIGSTLYHAFRSSNLLMWLDVAPIFVLTLSIGAFFYWMASKKTLIAILLLLSFIFLRYIGFYFFKLQTAINISYFLTGLYMFIPAWFLLRKTKFRGIWLLIASAFLFALSLFMRWYDDFPVQLFKAGTHWLWHILSAAGAMMLGLFIMSQKDKENSF